MKRLLLTIAVGDLHTQIGQITHPFMKDYASKTGADFHVIDSMKAGRPTAHWEKFRIYDFLDVYDRILYVDTDALISRDCPDLFKLIHKDWMAAFNEGWYFDRPYADYYNTGVMVIPRSHRVIFYPPEQEQGDIDTFFEQNFLNDRIHASGLDIYELSHKFNKMDFIQANGYIIHKAGNLNALDELKELARVLA